MCQTAWQDTSKTAYCIIFSWSEFTTFSWKNTKHNSVHLCCSFLHIKVCFCKNYSKDTVLKRSNVYKVQSNIHKHDTPMPFVIFVSRGVSTPQLHFIPFKLPSLQNAQVLFQSSKTNLLTQKLNPTLLSIHYTLQIYIV